MVKKESEPDDPIEMIGVELPNQTEEQLRDMALCFAEEFVREGWKEEQLMKLFRNPFYHGPYLVWEQKGDDFVRSVILEALKMWRPYDRTSEINPVKAPPRRGREEHHGPSL
ncbi:MAG: hypothetical protein A2787_01275 [Omnitrophica WOR_2 bacterium RIFCSPHIGHO2_01_FULL_48_9]|nr:MAG: hypothetical protein A2787_01275 [Omnitrophica WOR_2 bacterium RIFCSPHIGHO2_01_FULL_48_9]